MPARSPLAAGRWPAADHHGVRPRRAASIGCTQCQGDAAAVAVVGILIIRCLARRLRADRFGLAFMRFAGIGCEGPAGVT